MTSKVRAARIEDATAITECVTAAYQHYIDRIGSPPGPMLADYSQVIQKYHVLVLSCETNIIGVLVLIRQPRNLLVDNVAIHPACQRRGLGRQLLAYAEKEARRLGLPAITLYTNERMTENIELYKRLGYIETARKTEHGYKRIYMNKILMEETRS